MKMVHPELTESEGKRAELETPVLLGIQAGKEARVDPDLWGRKAA